MDRNTYWILDSAIESPKPLQWLHPDYPELAEALNRPHHGMSYAMLVALLLQLFHEGYLVVQHVDPDVVCEGDPEDPTAARSPFVVTEAEHCHWEQSLFIPIEVEIHQTLARTRYLQYAVTPKGGAVWEQVSAPQWHQYSVIHSSDYVYIAGGNKPLVERLVWLYPYGPGFSYDVVPDSLVWTEERPWRATYWKTVPEGYTVQFDTCPKPGPQAEWLDLAAYDMDSGEFAQLRQWYTPYVD